MTDRHNARRRGAVLGLGANVPGHWGTPTEALRRALDELRNNQVKLMLISSIFITKPVGTVRQPAYYNAVAVVQAKMSPVGLLRLLKRLERDAGRRSGVRWGPRPLDLDLLDFGGTQLGRGTRRRPAGRLILPHPELHRRAFTLGPLAEIAPCWRHPGLDRSALQLLRRLPTAERRGIKRLTGGWRCKVRGAGNCQGALAATRGG